MKKTVAIITLACVAGLGLVGCGDGAGDPGSSVVHHGTDPLPDVYGYDYIDILNNANSSNETIINIRDRYKHIDGYKATTVNRNVHCTDYQYSEGDKISENTINGIHMVQYIIGNMICTETDYQDGPAPLIGSDTIVVGVE
jgi:hypothetical protein